LLQRHEAALRGEFSDDEDEDEVYGDFEDLETGETHQADGEETGETEPKEAPKLKKDMTILERRAMKKARMKALFDDEYDKVTGGGKTHFDEVRKAFD
jgi:ribosome biogenesis protein BMS1